MGRTSQEVRDRYRKKSYKHYNIDVNVNTESDIVSIMEKQPNKQGFIKSAIREKGKKSAE